MSYDWPYRAENCLIISDQVERTAIFIFDQVEILRFACIHVVAFLGLLENVYCDKNNILVA